MSDTKAPGVPGDEFMDFDYGELGQVLIELKAPERLYKVKDSMSSLQREVDDARDRDVCDGCRNNLAYLSGVLASVLHSIEDAEGLFRLSTRKSDDGPIPPVFRMPRDTPIPGTPTPTTQEM